MKELLDKPAVIQKIKDDQERMANDGGDLDKKKGDDAELDMIILVDTLIEKHNKMQMGISEKKTKKELELTKAT